MAQLERTGDLLSSALLDACQGLPVILCTGYSDVLSAAQAKPIGVYAYLMKPFETVKLPATVCSTLDAPA